MNTRKPMAAHIVAAEEVAKGEVHFTVEAYDALQEKSFTGVVKVIDGMPQGHFIKPGKSPLSPPCLQVAKAAVLNAHNSK
ncbi:hypothetical protein [Priestia megaterium]|uniref:hypothetical protein n=1 Tax=Priestia megaterium TaxID=1404 RepID=UPI001F148734|nr:hypothetical protein [Priestia megaterium]UMZ35536.1 hypothetical protein MGJ28_12955 [Priestia megaterium]